MVLEAGNSLNPEKARSPIKESLIQQALSDQEHAIHRLHEKVEQLMSNIQPVLSDPQPNETIPPEDVGSASCALESGIRQNTRGVQDVIDTLTDLIERNQL